MVNSNSFGWLSRNTKSNAGRSGRHPEGCLPARLRRALGEAEPESISKFKFFWMAEPGHPHDVGVLHNRHLAAGTHEASAKR